MIRIFFVHGIDSLEKDTRDCARRVEVALWQAGIVASVTPGVWRSHGSILRDLFEVSTRRQKITDDVQRAFDVFLADVHANEPLLILGHSYGTVVARDLAARRASQLRRHRAPTGVCMLGSPFTHDLIALALPRATPIEGVPCTSIVNYDDPVCGGKTLDGWFAVQIPRDEIAPSPESLPAMIEHDAVAYVRAPSTLRALRQLIS